jgi:meso-butanediol dehydrogenase / (S,S)-butanediol dehydrogenase / diacetyl reductase
LSSRFDKRHVIVTGGGRGIGEATARRFAAEGAEVLVLSRTEAEVAAVAASIRSAGGSAWHAVGDVASAADVDRIVSAAEEHWAGQIDVLVNNAGVDHDCAVLEFPESEWRRVLDVNLTGPFLCAQRVARAMAARGGGGAIVHVASIDALGADGTQVAYNTSKAGLLGLNRTLAIELGPLGIRSTVVNPGYVATPLTRQYVGDEMYDHMMTRFARVPQGRMAEPDEIAAAILFLASDDARHINGIALTVDGGTTANLYIVETLPSAGS